MFSLTTEKLILKSLQMEDANALLAYRSEPAVWQFQLWLPQRLSDAQAFIRSAQFSGDPQQGRWNQLGVYRQDTNQLIGDIGLHLIDAQQAEIGYTIDPQWQRQGIAQTAVSRILCYLFEERHIHRVIANADSENAASIGLLRKLGFRQEGYFVESYRVNDTWHDEVQFALLYREWLPLQD
ncbi:MAG: GNAT family N-acetyltransferase [Anaerolineales bacterium]|nr:GNAT family N-acetyltransferase [Anaerolineales bacterium]